MGASSEGAVLHRARSYWFDTSEPYQPQEPLRGDVAVDCCVIGGGVTGLSAAYHLKRLDPAARVALLEAEVIGFGASGRNAGQLIVQFGGGDWPSQLRRYGAGRIGEGWAYVHDGIRLIEDLIAREGIDCDYAPTGYLKATLKTGGAAQLEAYRRFLGAIGQTAFFDPVEDLEGELSSPHLGAAIFDRRGGQFNPLKLVRGMRQAALRYGAQIFENSPVAEIQVTPSRILVQTGGGVVRCEKLILAANGFTHLLEGVERLGLGQTQTPLIVKATVTEPLTPAQWAMAGWPRRCAVNVVSDLFFSFAPTFDGRLLYVGGYYATSPRHGEIRPEIQWRLKEEGPEHLSSFFPKLPGLRTAQTWGGPISITTDLIPHVGATEDPRIVYGCGCWGNGMPLGAQNGLTLAEMSLGRATENTEAWFVRRRKGRWPNRYVTKFVADRVIARRRRRSREIGGALTPPIRFKT
jgi:glycine/D-amino acid oxidase-like deaminating enzyme